MPSDKGIEDPSATTAKESEAVDGAQDAKVGGDYETNESNSSPQQSIFGVNSGGEDTLAHKLIKKAQYVWKYLFNPNPEGGESDQAADSSPQEESDKQRLDTEGQPETFINTLLRYMKSLVGIFLVVAVAIAAIYFGTFRSDVDLESVFGNGLKELQLSFNNQTDRFWKILENRRLAHLRSKDPSQPLVFLLAAPPAAHEWVDCLAIKLALLLDPRPKETLARIHGEEEKANPPEQTKMTMDNLLKKEIEALHKVVIIHHLELLPPPSQLLFHSYCDDQNAPYKDLAFIFTVHMPVETSPSLSPKEAEGSVEKYLSGDVWAKDDKDAIAALLVRIADTVLLMNGETSGSARDFCS